LAAQKKLETHIPPKTTKRHGKVLSDLPLIRRGNRLSVIPVGSEQWDYIMSLQTL